MFANSMAECELVHWSCAGRSFVVDCDYIHHGFDEEKEQEECQEAVEGEWV
jgi:hypothetical protein